MRHAVLGALLLSACSPSNAPGGTAARDDAEFTPEFDAVDNAVPPSFTINVYPGPTDEGVVPQSFGPFRGDQSTDLSLELSGVVALTGQVTAAVATPWLTAVLPSRPGPISGLVALRRAGTVQSYSARLDASGDFTLDAAPGVGYELAIIPDDPTLPIETRALDLLSDQVDAFEIVGGRDVYGTVRGPGGQPKAGAQLWVEDGAGRTSTPVTTREDGSFHLRAAATGAWTLVSAGAADGRDPVLRFPLPTDTASAEIGIDYKARTTYAVDGRLVGDDGAAVAGRVRFTALRLNEYPADATLTAEVATDARGNFYAQLLPGRWTRQIIPNEGEAFSAPPLSTVDVSGRASLGEIELSPFILVSARITDAFGLGVSGAVLECVEEASDHRFLAFSADDGMISASFPAAPMRCEVEPPAERPDLARTPTTWDPTTQTVIPLSEGTLMTGRVTRGDPDAPLSYAVVEVVTPNLTAPIPALTDDEGWFEVRVPAF